MSNLNVYECGAKQNFRVLKTQRVKELVLVSYRLTGELLLNNYIYMKFLMIIDETSSQQFSAIHSDTLLKVKMITLHYSMHS